MEHHHQVAPRLANLLPYGAATLTTHHHELDRPGQRSKDTMEEPEHSKETDITTITHSQCCHEMYFSTRFDSL